MQLSVDSIIWLLYQHCNKSTVSESGFELDPVTCLAYSDQLMQEHLHTVLPLFVLLLAAAAALTQRMLTGHTSVLH